MSSASLEHIDAVDAFARTLFLRLRGCPSPVLVDVAAVVEKLHLALRQLRVEAADPDSRLRSAEASVYARQLRPLVEDCDFALKQLETVLEKYEAGRSSSRGTEALADRLAAVRSRIAGEATSVGMFLDTVQLHGSRNNAPTDRIPAAGAADIEIIKDKVDSVASKLFRRRDSRESCFTGDEWMWQEFRRELEKEGFSPEILQRHKDVLRAYIRELQSLSFKADGPPPTVRGMLAYEASHRSPPPPVPPQELPSPKELLPSPHDPKLSPVMKTASRMPDREPLSAGQVQRRQSSSSADESNHPDGSLALISTGDLMTLLDMDRVAAQTRDMSLHSSSPQLATPGRRNDLPLSARDVARSWPPPEPPTGQRNYTHSSEDASPELPTRRRQYYHSSEDPPPELPTRRRSYFHSSEDPPPEPPSRRRNSAHSSEDPNPSQLKPALMPSPASAFSNAGNAPRLGPDKYGREIPPNATWTKVRRALISLEVLERAGLRWEARPEFVAILGRLSREEVAEYSRQSAECRAARLDSGSSRRSYPHRDRDDSQRRRTDHENGPRTGEESEVTDDYDDDDDRTPRTGYRMAPYIVRPHDKQATSPAATIVPKPILKNKNENHVRFDPEPHEVEMEGRRPLDGADERRRPDSSRRRRERRDSDSRHEDRPRYSSSSRNDRERRNRREDRHIRKRTWGETIGAVGIGGAAASLLGVLAEAAAGS